MARFECAACGAEAGTVELVAGAERTQVRRVSFTSVLVDDVGADRATAVAAAIAAGGAARLYALDAEYASFFCPDCGASYCGAHWTRWDVFHDDSWHDSIRGQEGHERMLED